MSNKPPLISIGMPVYNGEMFVRQALDSLLMLTLGDVELIISDNASADGTGAICREYVSQDPRIRYVRQSENRGQRPTFSLCWMRRLGSISCGQRGMMFAGGRAIGNPHS